MRPNGHLSETGIREGCVGHRSRSKAHPMPSIEPAGQKSRWRVLVCTVRGVAPRATGMGRPRRQCLRLPRAGASPCSSEPGDARRLGVPRCRCDGSAGPTVGSHGTSTPRLAHHGSPAGIESSASGRSTAVLPNGHVLRHHEGRMVACLRPPRSSCARIRPRLGDVECSRHTPAPGGG